MICPKCRKEQLLYKPWLGQIWECRSCGYRGPLFLEKGKGSKKVLKK